ncbi:MAG: hypothetical protein M1839_003554, partial [Geoglossum umbratile]
MGLQRGHPPVADIVSAKIIETRQATTTINVIVSNLVQTSTPTVQLAITAVILPSVIEMPRIEPHLKTPIRQSTRTSKPSARKRANSESISQPPPSSQRAKKACTATALPVNPRRRQIAPNNIDEEEQFNEDEDAASTVIDDDAMDATQPK